MKWNKYHSKMMLWGITLSIIWIPMIQQFTSLFKENALNGAIEETVNPVLTTTGWLREKYQPAFESYLNQHFGFRNILVRFHNQIEFTLFNEVKANSVVVGKDDFLYEQGYIDAWSGKDFNGGKAIGERIKKLKRIQDTLTKLNKSILIVLAPGKASFFPEYIPEQMGIRNEFTNYYFYQWGLQKANLPFIDFNKHFVDLKSRSRYPLYSKCGIHWSKYGEYLAADSLIRYLSSFPHAGNNKIVLNSMQISEKNKDGDYDMGEGLNLLWDIKTYPMAYPQYHFQADTLHKLPRVLVVGDSYYWALYNKGFSRLMFNDGEFWYYNAQAYSSRWEGGITLFDVDMKQSIDQHEVMLILSTEANLDRFSFAFIENLYDFYFTSDPQKSTVKKVRLNYYTEKIKASPFWMNQFMKIREEEGLALDVQVRKLAEYMAWKEFN